MIRSYDDRDTEKNIDVHKMFPAHKAATLRKAMKPTMRDTDTKGAESENR